MLELEKEFEPEIESNVDQALYMSQGFGPKDPLKEMAPWTIGLVLDVMPADELLPITPHC